MLILCLSSLTALAFIQDDIEVNGAKERIIDCQLIESTESIEVRLCCEKEVDTETGETTLIGNCYTEVCLVGTDECRVSEDSGKPTVDPRDRPLTGEEELLPTAPPNTSQDEELTPPLGRDIENPLQEGGILKQPSSSSAAPPLPKSPEIFQDLPLTKGAQIEEGEKEQGLPGITDRTVDEREVLPTTPRLGETSPLQPPPPITINEEEENEATSQQVECNGGEILNELTGQCEPEAEQGSEDGQGNEDQGSSEKVPDGNDNDNNNN